MKRTYSFDSQYPLNNNQKFKHQASLHPPPPPHSPYNSLQTKPPPLIILQNQPPPPNIQQNQPLTPNIQQNQPLTPNIQQNQPLTPNILQNQPMTPNILQNQPLTPNILQIQPLPPNILQNQSPPLNINQPPPFNILQYQPPPLNILQIQPQPPNISPTQPRSPNILKKNLSPLYTLPPRGSLAHIYPNNLHDTDFKFTSFRSHQLNNRFYLGESFNSSSNDKNTITEFIHNAPTEANQSNPSIQFPIPIHCNHFNVYNPFYHSSKGVNNSFSSECDKLLNKSNNLSKNTTFPDLNPISQCDYSSFKLKKSKFSKIEFFSSCENRLSRYLLITFFEDPWEEFTLSSSDKNS